MEYPIQGQPCNDLNEHCVVTLSVYNENTKNTLDIWLGLDRRATVSNETTMISEDTCDEKAVGQT
jgi:hypothetical protein